ncbi:FIG00388607: hypothetical protein [hydrothermal vent metagenome]|uniref:HP0268 domain-containing protein n=1 Tax=hydrothermal vent metagenome TaxID=652676 RepID=A0A3B1DUG4_9ZZZZ
MNILLAREELLGKPEKITFTQLKNNIKETANEIYYFDRENSHKNMMSLVDGLESDGYSVHFREVKYGLSDEEYMYEIHIM